MATYNPSIFAAHDLQDAMKIILTPEDSTTAARWATETEYFAEMIEQSLDVKPETLLLDYGCGIGRLSKVLIERRGCKILGVDISPQMRMLAPNYVQSDSFSACSPDILKALIASGLRFDAAISIWVLQHCLAPSNDAALIEAALPPNAKLFVVNSDRRAVPTHEVGWADDGLNIRQLLADRFDMQAEGRLLEAKTTTRIAGCSFWALYARR